MMKATIRPTMPITGGIRLWSIVTPCNLVSWIEKNNPAILAGPRARRGGLASGRVGETGRRGPGLIFLVDSGPLSDAVALAEDDVADRRLFVLCPWLKETLYFHHALPFKALP